MDRQSMYVRGISESRQDLFLPVLGGVYFFNFILSLHLAIWIIVDKSQRAPPASIVALGATGGRRVGG